VTDRALGRQVPVAILLGGLAVAAFGLEAGAIPAVALAAVTPELVRVDLREHRLPNRMVVPGIVAGLVAAVAGWSALPVLAGVAFAGFLWLLGLRGGVGMGDVKLAALLGLASPTLAVAVAAPLVAFLLGGVAASTVLLRRGRGHRIAFGPWLLAGYWAVVGVSAAMAVSSAMGISP
jgi:leader peptidase (prepilin peptidase)/N-methyltransferase